MRAFILRRVGLIRHAQGGVVLVGPGHGGDTLRLQRFLTRNGYPHRLLDTEPTPDAPRLPRHASTLDARPSCRWWSCPGATVLRNPSNAALADALGLTETIDPATCLRRGGGRRRAGRAGGGGLRRVRRARHHRDRGDRARRPGGHLSKIENYSASRPASRARRWPAGRRCRRRSSARGSRSRARGRRARLRERPYRVALDGRRSACTPAPSWSRPAPATASSTLPNYDTFEGRASTTPRPRWRRSSAAARRSSWSAAATRPGRRRCSCRAPRAHVHILVRGDGLAATMSDYLVQRIEPSPQITRACAHARSPRSTATTVLRAVTWPTATPARARRAPIGNVFLMIGAEPNTDWLDGCLDARRERLRADRPRRRRAARWPRPTPPPSPGIYAVGDVRSGSVKRVASGVGEGSVVVQAIHQFLDARRRLMRQASGLLSIATSDRPARDHRASRDWVAGQGLNEGLLTLFCRHTSASLLIQENAAPAVASRPAALYRAAGAGGRGVRA